MIEVDTYIKDPTQDAERMEMMANKWEEYPEMWPRVRHYINRSNEGVETLEYKVLH